MLLEVIRIALGVLQANCYIAFDKQSRKGVIIDPGDSGDFILQEIVKREIKPIAVIATHGHFDHILAATHLTLTLQIPFFMNRRDEFLLERMQDSSRRFTKVAEDLPPKINESQNEGNEIIVGRTFFKVFETPGHTPGSISLYSPGERVVFVGDLVFSDASIGRSDFEYSDQKSLSKSLKRILKLPGKTTVYSGHGEESSIAKLKVLLKKSNFV